MLIKKRPSWALPHSEVTPESVYLNRRQFMSGTLAVAAGLSVPGLLSAAKLPVPGEALDFVPMPGFSTDEEKTPFEDVTQIGRAHV